MQPISLSPRSVISNSRVVAILIHPSAPRLRLTSLKLPRKFFDISLSVLSPLLLSKIQTKFHFIYNQHVHYAVDKNKKYIDRLIKMYLENRLSFLIPTSWILHEYHEY